MADLRMLGRAPSQMEKGGSPMVKAHSALRRAVLILGGLLFASAGVKAQVSRSLPLGENVGTFRYTAANAGQACDANLNYSYKRWDYDNMSFPSVDGVLHSLAGRSTFYIASVSGSPGPA